MNGLSIIIPSKNSSNLQACVAAIRQCGETCRVIVVDDTDGGMPPIAGVEMVKGEKPFNFSAAINAGIKAAGNDDVLLLNDDAILKTHGGFSRLTAACDADPHLGIVAACTNNVGNRNQLQGQGNSLRPERRQLCFIAVYIPRGVINEVGLLDADYTGCHQDDDYCYRVRRAGYRLAVHDGVFVDHATLPSTFRGPGGPGYSLKEGERIFAEKHGAYPL